jgi:hypothetical protein
VYDPDRDIQNTLHRAAQTAATTITYDELRRVFASGRGNHHAAGSVLEAYALYRSISLRWTRQQNLSNFLRYELQVSMDQEEWYSLKTDGSDWKNELDGATLCINENFLHESIPHVLDESGNPTGRTLYYRVRTVTKAALPSDWSNTATATTVGIIATDVHRDRSQHQRLPQKL